VRRQGAGRIAILAFGTLLYPALEAGEKAAAAFAKTSLIRPKSFKLKPKPFMVSVEISAALESSKLPAAASCKTFGVAVNISLVFKPAAAKTPCASAACCCLVVYHLALDFCGCRYV
jgi:hypothetical protein